MNKKIFIGVVIVAGFFLLVPITFAQSPLSVTFNPNPLFGASGILPGDETFGEIMVTNMTDTAQRVIIEAINVYDSDDLGEQLNLTILDGGEDVVFSNTLGRFLRAGKVFMSNLSEGHSKVYNFRVVFNKTADNDYQGKSLGFDLCVGFEGGTLNCGNTMIGDENNTNERDEFLVGGGGGNGRLLNLSQLNIFNESISDIDVVNNQVIIRWRTNLLSTSQVVYGLASNGPYSLDLNSPTFGYPASTVEDSTKVYEHAAILPRLTPGEIYLFRAVSRASPPTVSYEKSFIMPTLNSEAKDVFENYLALAQKDGGIFKEKNDNEHSNEHTILTRGGEMEMESVLTFETKNKGSQFAAIGAVGGFSGPAIWMSITALFAIFYIVFLKRKREG